MKKCNREKLPRLAVIAVLLLIIGACSTERAGSGSGPEPVLHPPGGRIEFSRRCADEDAFRVKAYARIEYSTANGPPIPRESDPPFHGK